MQLIKDDDELEQLKWADNEHYDPPQQAVSSSDAPKNGILNALQVDECQSKPSQITEKEIKQEPHQIMCMRQLRRN